MNNLIDRAPLLPAIDVAIVIAVYNGASTLERCLDSVARQTNRAAQVVVMDGGSSDGTQEVLARRGDVVTTWVSEPDHGIYDAWNKALRHVTAEWVAFLGADDYLWDEYVLERFAEKLKQLPEDVPFVYGRLVEVDAAGTPMEEHGVPWDQVSGRFPYEMVLPHPGMLHRRAVFFDERGFDPVYRIAGDYALLRPVLIRKAPAFVDFRVAGAQEGGVSSRPDRRVDSIREVGRAIEVAGERKPLEWHWIMLKNKLRMILWRYGGEAFMEWVRGVYRELTGRARRSKHEEILLRK